MLEPGMPSCDEALALYSLIGCTAPNCLGPLTGVVTIEIKFEDIQQILRRNDGKYMCACLDRLHLQVLQLQWISA